MVLGGTCLGVDISGNDIKAVELRRFRNKYEVVQAARLKVGDNIAATIASFMAETHTSCSKIVLSLPTNACSVKFAALPKTKPAETAKMAHYEAETQIPLPLTDLIWGYSAEKQARGEDMSHIVIAGVRRTIAEETASMLESYDLPLSALVVGSLAEAHGLRGVLRSYDEPVLLIDVGDEWTDITTVGQGQVAACRSLHVGTDSLARAVADDLGISFAEAQQSISHRHMPDCAVISGGSNGRAVEKWFESLCGDIRRSAMASAPGVHSQPIKTALLVGEGATVPGLAAALAERTHLKAEVGEPWTGMSLRPAVIHNTHDLPAVFAGATGLAMVGLERSRVINLVPTGRAERLTKERKGLALSASLGLAALGLLAVLVGGNSSVKAKAAELQDLRSQVRAARKHPVAAQPGLKTTTQTMDKILKETRSGDNSAIEILLQLSQSLPTSCWLSEVQFESGKSVVLRGSALSNSSIADLVYMLSDASAFKSVSLDYSNIGRGTNNPAYDFQVRCTVPANAMLVELSKHKNTKERLVVR